MSCVQKRLFVTAFLHTQVRASSWSNGGYCESVYSIYVYLQKKSELFIIACLLNQFTEFLFLYRYPCF